MTGRDALDLWDFRRRVSEMYREVQTGPPREATWRRWRAERDELFAGHPQSAIDPAERAAFGGLRYFDFDPAWRFEAEVEPVPDDDVSLTNSDTGSTGFRTFGTVNFTVAGRSVSLTMYWLDGYAGGVFLPFRDASSGTETYGDGRYLLDTAKGADLGHRGAKVVLDFNYAYHPSCVYDTRWSCPLAPRANWLDIAVPVGERLPGTGTT